MIGIVVTGGLGNQFFRYAYGRVLLEQRRAQGISDRVIINYSGVDGHGFSGNLHDFNIAGHEVANSSFRTFLRREGTLVQFCVYALFKALGMFFHGSRYLRLKHKLLSASGVVISDLPDNEVIFTPPY